jgi:hypothetical protein
MNEGAIGNLPEWRIYSTRTNLIAMAAQGGSATTVWRPPAPGGSK